jgi:hypothetical protein
MYSMVSCIISGSPNSVLTLIPCTPTLLLSLSLSSSYIAIVCVVRCGFCLFIIIDWGSAFTIDEVLAYIGFVGAVFMPGRMFFFADCTFVGFTLTLACGVVFAAFGTYFMGASTSCSMVSELLTFVALYELKLWCILFSGKTLLLDIDSVLDVSVGRIRA